MSKGKKGSHSAVARIYVRTYFHPNQNHVHPKDDINLLKGGLKR